MADVEETVAEKVLLASKSDDEFAKINMELSKRTFERRPAVFHMDTGAGETKPLANHEISGDAAAKISDNLSGRSEFSKAEPAFTIQALTDGRQAKLEGAYPLGIKASLIDTASRPDTADAVSISLRESTASRGLDSVMTTGTGYTDTTGPSEEPFLQNEDLSEEDRNKAIAWSAASQGIEHVGFLPECVLKTGFKIKKFKLWMPLEICVDYRHKRLTVFCPDSLKDVLLRKSMAHRIEVGDVKVETPLSSKSVRGGRSSTSVAGGQAGDNAAAASGTSAPRFSKRRLNMIRTDGTGKYRLIAPTTEYRDRFLDILFMMTGPKSTTPHLLSHD